MPDAQVVEWIRDKYLAIVSDLDERARRRWAAAEARSLGWGGTTAVAMATGISDRTVRNGITELDDPDTLPPNRQRKSGAGRRSREYEAPGLIKALEALMEPISRGDPMSPLRWTCKSTYVLADELKAQGFVVSSTKVAALLKSQGYSLQANRKTLEGKQHPDRNAQFEHIARRVKTRQRCGEPAISIDTKKKEPLGNMKNPGKTYRRKGQPIQVKTHDFPDKELGKAVPYGVYDLACNEAGVTVGIGHDTAEFAVASIRRWWKRMGRKRYDTPRRLLITADSGGSNSPRTRLWLWELQRFADETGMILEICHYPPGTSKWNKIEHRLFSHITMNWRGRPLVSHEVVVNLIGATKTETGLKVKARLDTGTYPLRVKVSDEELAQVAIHPHPFHGEWNYTIKPHRDTKM